MTKESLSVPRTASTLILLATESSVVKVALLRRAQSARFLPGALVFPGGSVEVDDDQWLHTQLNAEAIQQVLSDTHAWGFLDKHQAMCSLGAALRETLEEAKLEPSLLSIDSLKCIGHWLTPEALKVRFDTYFWGAEIKGELPQLLVDQEEIESGLWVAPHEALVAYEEGEIELPAPTLCVLAEMSQLLEEGATITEVFHSLNVSAHAQAICPVLEHPQGSIPARLYLPGDPHYLNIRGDAPRVNSTVFWQVNAHYLERRSQRPYWVRCHQSSS